MDVHHSIKAHQYMVTKVSFDIKLSKVIQAKANVLQT